MTLVVGVRCTDGAVLASDSATTFGTGEGTHTIGQQPSQKVEVIDEIMLFATAGAVGLSQSLQQAVQPIHGHARPGQKAADRVLAKDALETAIRSVLLPKFQGVNAARAAGVPKTVTENVYCETLIAMPVNNDPELYLFDGAGQGEAATDEIWFFAIGSGQSIADPFLAHLRHVFWEKTIPSVSEGTFAAVWTVQHAIDTNPGGIGGDVQVATLERREDGTWESRLHEGEQMDEHRQAVQEAEEHLRRFLHETRPHSPAAEPPKPPESS